MLTLFEGNVKPTVNVTTDQDLLEVTTVSQDAGVVSLSANVLDLNEEQMHSFEWVSKDQNLVFSNSNMDNVTFDPLSVPVGLYSYTLTVSDNGQPVESLTFNGLIKIIEFNPVLNDEDSDGDLIDDLTEGYSDIDQNRIPEYLDVVSSLQLLPAGELTEQSMLKTLAGHKLSLGDFVFASDLNDASLPLESLKNVGGDDFVQSELFIDQGMSHASGIYDVNITLNYSDELTYISFENTQEIQATSRIRKYDYINGWTDFVENENNKIYSAAKSELGCPEINDDSYELGLVEGNECVSLQILEGGSNDADQLSNAFVKFTFSVAEVLETDQIDVTYNSVEPASLNSESVVLEMQFVTQSTNQLLDSLTFNTAGTIDKLVNGVKTDSYTVTTVNIYHDINNDGVANANELLVSSDYLGGQSNLVINFDNALQVSPVTTALLVTYQFELIIE